MANGLYEKSKELYAFPNILVNNIKVALTRGYAPDFVNDEFLSIIPGGDIIGTSGNMAGKTFAQGVYDANNTTIPAVPAGAACNYLVIYYDTGVAATSRLLAALDTGFAGLPVVPDGSDILVTWAAGGIFKL